MRWGLKVPWETGAFINAKSETLTTLKLYHLHLNQRCLLLADGFHEGGALFYQPGKTVFCLAGLWREESGVRRFTMLTTSPITGSCAVGNIPEPTRIVLGWTADVQSGNYLGAENISVGTPRRQFRKRTNWLRVSCQLPPKIVQAMFSPPTMR
jgi:hypothetical protein